MTVGSACAVTEELSNEGFSGFFAGFLPLSMQFENAGQFDWPGRDFDSDTDWDEY